MTTQQRHAGTERGTRLSRPLRRAGSFITEAVIAVLILGTALIAATKMAASGVELIRASDARLATTLAAQNTVERLDGMPVDQVKANADRVAADVSEICQCRVDADVQTLNDPLSGVHLTVVASSGSRQDGRSPAVRLHRWYLTANDLSDDQAAQEAQP